MVMIHLVSPGALYMTSSLALPKAFISRGRHNIAYIFLEFSYTAKHVEEHGRAGAYDPWSIRQIGVHHKYIAARNQNVFVLLNPSSSLVKRIDSLLPDTEMLNLHRLILCAVTERWIQYLGYLEIICKDIVGRPKYFC